MTYQVLVGDCLEHMRGMEGNSIDACITDPPYGLGTQKRFGPGQKATKGPGQYARQTSGFMNLDWDRTGIENSVELWSEVYRILKPGAFCLAFGGSQTFHRMACAVEDAGFELKQSIAWLYATGFPHGLNVALQFEQRLCDRVEVEPDKFEWLYKDDKTIMTRVAPFRSPLANDWDGYNTSLKPAFEPIIVGRKPPIGSVAENIEAFGTGCYNVDDCRIDVGSEVITDGHSVSIRQGTYQEHDGWNRPWKRNNPKQFTSRLEAAIQRTNTMGRYPSNVILDDEMARELDRQSGVSGGGKFKDRSRSRKANVLEIKDGWNSNNMDPNGGLAPDNYGDTGGASRFFFVAKPTRREKDLGLNELVDSIMSRTNPGGLENDPRWAPKHVKNNHGTVKPVTLMKYLCRLATPTGGTVLDCFLGSGSTGVAAIEEGFNFIGIEKDESYAAIAEARIAHAVKTKESKGVVAQTTITVADTTFVQDVLPGVNGT